jgi:hypothetical protein
MTSRSTLATIIADPMTDGKCVTSAKIPSTFMQDMKDRNYLDEQFDGCAPASELRWSFNAPGSIQYRR